MSQQVYHLACGYLLGVEQVVDAHVYEDLLAVGFEILVVVDAGYGLLRTQLLGHDGREYVVVLDGVHGDEQVALARAGLAQYAERRGIALDGYDVRQIAHLCQRLRVGIGNGYIVAVAAEHLGKMTAHISRTGYNNLHNSLLSKHIRSQHRRLRNIAADALAYSSANI